MKKQMVVDGTNNVSAQQLSELFRQIGSGEIGGREIQAMVEHRNPWAQGEATLSSVRSWKLFYKKYFGLALNLSRVRIPERTTEQAKEFTRLIIVAGGLTLNQVYDACFQAFDGNCKRYVDDLDVAVTVNERDPKTGSYAIWVRDIVEADEVHKDKSAGMVQKEKLQTETLLERMLHGLKYYAETGKHLDVSNNTLCSGSHDSADFVPRVDWSGKFRVFWCIADDRDYCLRPREVVS